MSENRILIMLLWMYFQRNWEFGSALSKLQNFGGGGGVEPPRCAPATTVFVNKSRPSSFILIRVLIYFLGGTWCCSWLRHYKPEGRGFDSRWCRWNFSLT
jgi:hypothetical protein